jgi:hypothetical protein
VEHNHRPDERVLEDVNFDIATSPAKPDQNIVLCIRCGQDFVAG